jgi:hypothetical protein
VRKLKWFKKGDRHILAEIGIKAGKKKRDHGMVYATIRPVKTDLYSWVGEIISNPMAQFKGYDLDVIKADIEAVFNS